MNTLRRRLLLAGCAAIGATSLGYVASRYACKARDGVAFNQRLLESLIASKESATRIGQTYLTMSSAARLRMADLVSRRPDLVFALTHTCESTGRALVFSQIETDFECGNVVLVDGWVLAESEAILCSLYTSS